MNARILVVDDDLDIIELVSSHLREQGYEVIAAASGMEALNQARRHLPDLVLLDLVLGDIDGISVCQILRCQPSTTAIPVILLTAMAGELARLNGLAAGADDFLAKPLRAAELLSRVKHRLEVCAAERQTEDLGMEEATVGRRPAFGYRA